LFAGGVAVLLSLPQAAHRATAKQDALQAELINVRFIVRHPQIVRDKDAADHTSTPTV
jgi:hypothetical protein